MSHHFRAFSFVDRIDTVEPGVSATGSYQIPAGLDGFSSSLVAESTGQLAAWSAVAKVDFVSRPLAGIAGLVEMLGPVNPGDRLELAIRIESVDEDAITYGGTASVDGQPVLRLQDCVGPMLPCEDFDDPAALRERFALLCGAGAEEGAVGGLPALSLEDVGIEPGESAHAVLQVPEEAPFFEDHFPRRAVFPGSLLMQYNLELAGRLAGELPAPAGTSGWELRSVSNMKLRAFIPKGERLELEAKVLESAGDTATISVNSRRGKRPAGAATVILAVR
jgi:3-hydroxymyristoyl/3-hydroxydecanoyl-(acyl carrier protein) dehydratase